MTEPDRDVDMADDVEQQSQDVQPGANIMTIPISADEELSVNLDTELTEVDEMSALLENLEAQNRFYLTVGMAYARKGDFESALQIVNKGLNLESVQKDQSDLLASYSCLAWIYLRWKRTAPSVASSDNPTHHKTFYQKQATEYINRAMQIDKNTTSNVLARGALNLSAGKFDDALTVFIQSLRESNNANLFAQLGKARVLYEKKNYREALKLYQIVLMGRPSIKPDPRIGIGLCFWHLGDQEAALTSWERSEELYQSEAAYTLISLAHMEKALKDIESDEFALNYAKSVEYAQRAIRINKNNSPAAVVLGSYLFSRRNNEMVVKLADRAVAASDVPRLRAEGFFWKGRAYHYMGEYDNALECFDQAIELNKSNVLAHIGRGLVQMEQGKGESLLTFESIVNNHPQSMEALLLLGLLYDEKMKKELDDAKTSDGRSVKEEARKKAVSLLEKYLRMMRAKDEQPPLEALLTLAKLTENNIDRTLAILQEVISNHPLEGIAAQVYNNVGVLNYIKGNLDAASINFETAANELKTHPNEQMEVTLEFNQARLQDALGNLEEARAGYTKVLAKQPDYLEARIRMVYLNLVTKEGPAEDEMNKLMDLDGTNLTVRALEGWNLRRQRKGIKRDAEINHYKDTLKLYDKHDSYALIAMGNIYLTIAREVRGNKPADLERKEKQYFKASEFFFKALQIDKNNAFAAQGIAIIFAETKRGEMALPIFSKIRETLNDVSIYINMGHCFGELRQFQKAIECYELALTRFNNEDDPQLLTLLGKAWYARGRSERNIEALNKSIDYSRKALEQVKDNPGLMFNIAFVQFDIAQSVIKLEPQKRTVELIQDATEKLKEGIEILQTLIKNKQAPFEDVEARVTMGQKTMLNQLERALASQTEYEQSNQQKLEEARKKQQEEREKLESEREKRLEEERKREEALAEERKRLQAQAREWAEKAQEDIQRQIEREEEERQEKEERKERRKSSKAEPKEKKSKKSKSKKKKKRSVDDDDDEGSAEETPEPEQPSSSRKKSALSKDYISDSDDISSDDEPEAEATPPPTENGGDKMDIDDEEESNKRGGDTEEKDTPRKKRRIVDDDDDNE